jgi:hypothetical protein
MKWTGRGVLRVDGKDIHAGQDIPAGMDEKQIKRLKDSGDIDGKLSGRQYEEAQARVEENKRKAIKSGKVKTKDQLKKEHEAIQNKISKLKVGKDDEKIAELESELEKVEKLYNEAE